MPFGLFSGFSNQGQAIIDPSSIFGSNLVAWYRGDSLVNSSGTVATWNDKSTNGNTLTASGSAKPTYNSSSATFNNQITASFNGSTNTMISSNLVGGGAGDIYYAFIVANVTAHSGNTPSVILQLNATSTSYLYVEIEGAASSPAGAVLMEVQGTINSGSMNWSGVPLSLSCLSVGGSGTVQTYLNEDNLDNLNVAVTTAVNPSWTGAVLNVGAFNGSGYTNMEVAEIVICNVQPTTKQNAQLFRYAQNRYNVDPPITTSAITNVSTSGGGARITGTGFNSSTTVSNTTLGNLTVVYKSSSLIEITVPAAAAGAYDINITNTNTGLTYTRNSFIQVQSSATYDPMAILGTGCVAWYQANQVTSTSGNVTSIFDQSLLSNTLSSISLDTGTAGVLTFSTPTVTLTGGTGFTSAMTGSYVTISNSTTGSNDGVFKLTYISATSISWTNASGAADASAAVHWQVNTGPTLNATDATFSSQPSMSYNGSSQYLVISSFNWETASPIPVFFMAVAEGTASPGSMVSYATPQLTLQINSNTGQMQRGGNNATYGTAELNVARNFTGYFTSSTLYINVDNGGSPVTTSISGTALTTNLGLSIGARDDGSGVFFTGKIAAVVVANIQPTSTQLINLQTWANSTFGT